MARAKLLSLLVTTILLIEISRSQCQNGGVNILTRKKELPHVIGYSCLCPYNYYGESCENFRQIYCRFSNQKITKYDPKQSNQANLQFDFECYLIKLNQNATEKSKEKNNFYKLPISQTIIKEELSALNYYIDQQYQIIWANDTSLFENNGQLIRNNDDQRTDEEILDSYPRYQFSYSGDFYGIPLSNVDVYFNLTVVSLKKNSMSLPTPAIIFKQIPWPSAGQIGYQNIGSLSLEIKKQWEEYGVVRLQISTMMQYGEAGMKLSHRSGMNSAKWRIFNPTITKGTILQATTNKVPSSLWVILAFLSLFCLIYGGRLTVRLYKRYKNRKNIKQLEEDDEEAYQNRGDA